MGGLPYAHPKHPFERTSLVWWVAELLLQYEKYWPFDGSINNQSCMQYNGENHPGWRETSLRACFFARIPERNSGSEFQHFQMLKRWHFQMPALSRARIKKPDSKQDSARAEATRMELGQVGLSPKISGKKKKGKKLFLSFFIPSIHPIHPYI